VPVQIIEAVESPQLTTTLKGHSEYLWQVTWAPDGKTLASLANGPCEIKLWDVAARKERMTLRSDLGASYGLAFAPDGKTLVVGHYKNDAQTGPTGGISLWDLATGQRTRLLQQSPPRGVGRLALASDGKALATLESAKEGDKREYTRYLTLWDLARGKVQSSTPADLWSALAFSADGKVLARAIYTLKDNRLDTVEVRRRDLTTDKDLPALSNTAGKNPIINCLAFAPDGRTLAGSDHDGNILLWDTASGNVRTIIKQDDQRPVTSLAFSPDGKMLAGAVGHRRGRNHVPGLIVLYDADTGRKRLTLTGHTNAVLSVAFSPDGKLLASGSSDRTVRLWDVSAHSAAAR
jgi:WD40 repeat protein